MADGRPIGTAATHSFELTLPGETLVPALGVTAVGVLPSHRRQGVLSTMMAHQLADLRARGAFLSVLLSAEATIYERFGYGPATYTQRLTVQLHQAALPLPLSLPRTRTRTGRRTSGPPTRTTARSRYCVAPSAAAGRR
jgi:hypothetical protein